MCSQTVGDLPTSTFATAYADIQHPDLMVGIPLYSDLSTEHDYVVQADGAFDETIRGILNLKRLNQRVEIRVVIHKQTYQRLANLAEFIARNLLFVDHVALMGLEITGFTRFNLNDLWIDPVDYREQLWQAVSVLSSHRMNVSVYNHQLCVLDLAYGRMLRSRSLIGRMNTLLSANRVPCAIGAAGFLARREFATATTFRAIV